MSELVRLSPLKDDIEIEAAVAALRAGQPVVLPDSFGLVLALNAEVEDAASKLQAMCASKPYLTLPARERFDRVFNKTNDPLQDWYANPAQGEAWWMRAAHVSFPRGMDFRFPFQESVARRTIENAKVPTYTAKIPDVKGRQLGARMLMARYGSDVGAYVEDPFQRELLEPTRAYVLKSGIAVEDSRVQVRPMWLHFVCLGNINRSAFAKVYLEAEMQRDAERAYHAGLHFLPAYEVSSSGVIARHDNAPPDGMIAAARAHGLEHEMMMHRSMPFQLSVANLSDIVVPMSADVRDKLSGYGLGERLAKFGRAGEIVDPMGGHLDDYVATATQIEVMLQRFVLSMGTEIKD